MGGNYPDVHAVRRGPPLWMFPPIFLLAVGLGYAYERTGNLWDADLYSLCLQFRFDDHLLAGKALIVGPQISESAPQNADRFLMQNMPPSIDEQIRPLARRCERILTEEDLRQKLKRSPKPASRCASSSAWTRPRRTSRSATRCR